MPEWLCKLLLEKDGYTKTIDRVDNAGTTNRVEFSPNQTKGIVPVIAQLLEQDRQVLYAYICHPSVMHMSKLFREGRFASFQAHASWTDLSLGGFCGYRNIQSMISYIFATKSQGYSHFNGRIPSIFTIQAWIESGWDQGINQQGRVETGGVSGSRKYIGTPEVSRTCTYYDSLCTDALQTGTVNVSWT